MAAPEMEAFLTHPVVSGGVSASTQNQAKPSQRLPVVPTGAEVRAVLASLERMYRLVGMRLYGAGLRLMEAVRLRVKAVDLGRRELLARGG